MEEKILYLVALIDFILNHRNKMWKLLKIKNENSNMMSMVSFCCLYF